MKYAKLLVIAFLLTSGCSSQYGYRYRPHPQQPLNSVYADYRAQGDTVDILIDTNGLRLQSISLLNHDGTFIKPTSIDYPHFEDELLPSESGPIHGPSLGQGPTTAHFAKSDIGPAPWEAHMEIQGMKTTIIRIGG